MGPEEGRHHPQGRAACQLAEDVEQLRLVVEVEPVAGFRLDRGRPIGQETVGAALRESEQRRFIGLARCPHGSRDATLFRLLDRIGDTARSLCELVGARAGEHGVGVRVDQAGDDAGSLGVEQVAVEGDLGLELAVLPDPDHASLAGRQRAVLDAP